MFKRLFIVLVFLMAAPGVACADTYLAKYPTDLTAEELVVVARPAPVQLIFQFRTKGSFNPHATQFLAAEVLENVRASGAFSEVTTGPAPGGAVLTITLENIPEADLFRKEVMNALRRSMGSYGPVNAADYTATDFYICTLEYSPGPDAAVVTRQVGHRIITTAGMKAQPPDTVRAASVDEAVLTMARHVVTRGVNDLAGDAGFVLDTAPPAMAASRPGAPSRIGSIAALRELTATGIPPIKLGAFTRGPKMPAGDDKTMQIRLVTVNAFGGSFSGYMRSAVESELMQAGKLDPASALELSAFLVKREVHSNDPADATVSARFVLKRDGVVIYDKVQKATDGWKAGFVGAYAIPDAIYRYYSLYGVLARTLLLDPEFVAAAKGVSPPASGA